MSIYQEVLGRFISRAEALRIAREILDRAERERLDIAEYEAARGSVGESSMIYEFPDTSMRIRQGDIFIGFPESICPSTTC